MIDNLKEVFDCIDKVRRLSVPDDDIVRVSKYIRKHRRLLSKTTDEFELALLAMLNLCQDIVSMRIEDLINDHIGIES
jgi:hypothetical protein